MTLVAERTMPTAGVLSGLLLIWNYKKHLSLAFSRYFLNLMGRITRLCSASSVRSVIAW